MFLAGMEGPEFKRFFAPGGRDGREGQLSLTSLPPVHPDRQRQPDAMAVTAIGVCGASGHPHRVRHDRLGNQRRVEELKPDVSRRAGFPIRHNTIPRGVTMDASRT
jgi:hypothetical protein